MLVRRISLLTSLSLLLLACGDDSSSGGDPTPSTSTGEASTGVPDPATDDAPGSTGADDTGSSSGEPIPTVEPGPDGSVTAFDGAHVYFLGDDNRRSIDVEVDFPPAELGYASATLELGLRCPPDGGCDWWDRAAYLGVVENPGTDDERILEIARFMTPYRVGGSWTIDVTGLRPLLSGRRTLRVFIDTWVGPGHANGAGWLVDARFDLVGGVPDQLPRHVIPLWPYSEATIGDPLLPPADQLPPVTVDIPETASRVELHSIITGHGQGNADNCAEFCQHVHGYLVGGLPVQRTVWRDDCADNPIDNQSGTWTYPRAGWCPGADVIAWIEDVTDGVVPGQPVEVAYGLSDYENTCRPDAPVCMGCALGTGCEYDGGNHTAPVVRMSAMLVVYEDTH